MPNKISERVNFTTGLAWEPLRGYARAVKVGDHLFVSGTTSVNEKGDVVGVGDAYLQTKMIIQHIRDVLKEAGFQMNEVVRTRMFVTDISLWKQYAQAHREAFESIRPASSIVEVSALIDPRMLVELEVEAIKGAVVTDTQSIKIGAK
jgi:enamine deaminase RidA (YjgF/YER057c/UK114 family)